MLAKHCSIVRLALSFGLLIGLANAAFSQEPGPAPQLPNKAYEMLISGTATMYGNWKCGGDVSIDAKPNASAEPVPGFGEGIRMISVTAVVPRIECGSSLMNKNLRKALKADSFPEIRYQAKNYVLVDNGSAVQTSGELTIAGVTKNVNLGAKMIPLYEGGVRVVGDVDIDMVDFGVKPPSIFLGLVKVARTVTVKFDTIVQLPIEATHALFPENTIPAVQ